MHENKILEAIDSLTLGTLSYQQKSAILADVNFSLQGKRTASNINDLILSKVNDLHKGMYKESQIMKSYYQDFSENESYPKAFEITNKEEIDKFLNKMLSKEYKGNFFDDTWNFYHPHENLIADGVAKHRSDFNTINAK
jgi:hypothetical protein